ncbi:ATP-binding protein [Pseudalkalibacillus decolorationis]|uniref:ATP-binding protein n=1 Tax=Pseudalkalibacillus decolorationis TaxID=163879 RepID=UPI002147F615|nr:sensor histidine kinase [Pseudalkalibacillus decolorationis]
MNSLLKVSLQTKLLGLILSLLLFVIIVLTGVYSYWESKQTEEQMGQLALQVATTVSFMPMIKDAFELGEPSLVIQPIAEQIRTEVGAEFVVVGNKESVRYSHPDEWKIGRKMVGGDNAKALKSGDYYTSKAIGSLGPSLRGKAPIYNDEGNIIGIVSVGFMQEDIQATVYQKFVKIGGIALLVVVIGGIGAVLLARNVRKDILGLEPHQIAALYRERNAILYSIKEGIIAVDEKGIITMMNHSAKKLLDLNNEAINKPIEKVLPNTKMFRVLQSGKIESDQEMLLKDRVVIVNRTPIYEKREIVGVVASFRDKTEVTEMVNTLSEVRQYSEGLRAQTHEFTNKLYVISGLLQLGDYKEAIEMIQFESKEHSYQNRILFEQIHDKKVQAIILGKVGKASEKKITFTIDRQSSLGPLPKHIDISKLITILGNIIDNAFEAVLNSKVKEVVFFATDMGQDVVFEIADTGYGIEAPLEMDVFTQGYSTKVGQDRGYGLAIVKEVVDELDGSIEIQQLKEGGTVFSIFLPKELKVAG